MMQTVGQTKPHICRCQLGLWEAVMDFLYYFRPKLKQSTRGTDFYIPGSFKCVKTLHIFNIFFSTLLVFTVKKEMLYKCKEKKHLVHPFIFLVVKQVVSLILVMLLLY